jgi:hypothetical protein
MEEQAFGALSVRRSPEQTVFVFRQYAGRFWVWIGALLGGALAAVLTFALIDFGFSFGILVADLVCLAVAALALWILLRPKRELGRRVATISAEMLALESGGAIALPGHQRMLRRGWRAEICSEGETVRDRDREFVVQHHGLELVDEQGTKVVLIAAREEPFDLDAIQRIREEVQRRLAPVQP